jgi:DivIVA domain-containing protein
VPSGSIQGVKLVFVVLLLVLVVAIAVVASGRGTALGEVEPDRPPVGLPPEPLTPGDLHAVRLPTALRGYRMQEVDEVLDRLAIELTARDTRIAELEAALAGTSPPAPPDRGGAGGAREEPSDG